MTTKVHGFVNPGEFLGRDLQFFTITTAVDVRPTSAGGNATSQARLDKLVEIISQRGQPIILGVPYADGVDFVVKFATEHAFAWTAETLEASILANQKAGMGFTGANTAIVVGQTL